jgi:cephalosporin hydroxylase
MIIKTDVGNGHFSYTLPKKSKSSYTLSQVPDIAEYFEPFLVRQNFDIVLEIGTYKGGLTILLDVIKKVNKLKFELISIDASMWNDKEFKKLLKDFSTRNIRFTQIDSFSDAGIDFIRTILQSDNKVCLLCDGGDKIREFNLYSKYLKPGDFIMAHDYYHDIDPYPTQWKWQEIRFTDIADSVSKNNLSFWTNPPFPTAAWGCYMKLS